MSIESWKDNLPWIPYTFQIWPVDPEPCIECGDMIAGPSRRLFKDGAVCGWCIAEEMARRGPDSE